MKQAFLFFKRVLEQVLIVTEHFYIPVSFYALFLQKVSKGLLIQLYPWGI